MEVRMPTPEETWTGPLEVLQRQRLEVGTGGRLPSEAERAEEHAREDAVRTAAVGVAYYQDPTQDEAYAHQSLSRALTEFLVAIAREAPPSPERSTAIARAREAKFWASAAIAGQRLQRPRPPITGGD
jgi:hypothetical protein